MLAKYSGTHRLHLFHAGGAKLGIGNIVVSPIFTLMAGPITVGVPRERNLEQLRQGLVRGGPVRDQNLGPREVQQGSENLGASRLAARMLQC